MKLKVIVVLGLTILLTLGLVSTAFAGNPSPTGTGQPGAPNNTCFTSTNTASSPGQSKSAGGSVFNPNGTSGQHYAGNDGTASLAHANSSHAVSQYDVACFQVTTHPH